MMRLRSGAGGRRGETVGGFLGAWWLDVSKGDVLDAESFYHGVVVLQMGPEGQGGGKYQENNGEGENSGFLAGSGSKTISLIPEWISNSSQAHSPRRLHKVSRARAN